MIQLGRTEIGINYLFGESEGLFKLFDKIDKIDGCYTCTCPFRSLSELIKSLKKLH